MSVSKMQEERKVVKYKNHKCIAAFRSYNIFDEK